MLKIKAGVRPHLLTIAAAVANVAAQWNITVTITSGTDGVHMQWSKHYTFDALDIRSKAPFASLDEKRAFLKAVLKRLGPHYQGILENVGEPSEHFHVERDPQTHGH